MSVFTLRCVWRRCKLSSHAGASASARTNYITVCRLGCKARMLIRQHRMCASLDCDSAHMLPQAALVRPPLSSCLRVNPLRTTAEVQARPTCWQAVVLHCCRRAPWLCWCRSKAACRPRCCHASARIHSACTSGSSGGACPEHMCARDAAAAADHSAAQAMGMLRTIQADAGSSSVTLCPDARAQSVAERLPAALAPADRDMLAAIGPPATAPDVPGAVIVPGSGLHAVDYSPAGEAGRDSGRYNLAEAPVQAGVQWLSCTWASPPASSSPEPSTLAHSLCAGGREVVVSRKAGEAVLRGAPVFIPGVLSASAEILAGTGYSPSHPVQ